MFIRFKELRECNELTREQLAKEIDERIEIIESVENGYMTPIRVLIKYAQFFNVTCDYLVDLSDDERGYANGNRIN